MRLSTFYEELKTEQEALAIEVKANPEVSRGLETLAALQNRDQRVVDHIQRPREASGRGGRRLQWDPRIAGRNGGSGGVGISKGGRNRR